MTGGGGGGVGEENLVLDVPEGTRVILATKMAAKRSQLWRMTSTGVYSRTVQLWGMTSTGVCTVVQYSYGG